MDTDGSILEIGGVRIHVSESSGVDVVRDDVTYHDFYSGAGPGSPDADVQVRISVGDVPDVAGFRKVFSTTETWTLFASDETRYLSFHPPDTPEPFWGAKMDRRYTDVHITCGERMVHSRDEGTVRVFDPVHYPLDQFLLMQHLAGRDGVIIHGAGIEIDGVGYLFAGVSGAGKSTVSRVFAARGDSDVLNDDRCVVKQTEDGWRVYGTPWPGETGMARNVCRPLGGVFFLQHSSANACREVEPARAIEALLPVTSVPWYDETGLSDVLETCEKLVSAVPTRWFDFTPDEEAGNTIAILLSGGRGSTGV